MPPPAEGLASRLFLVPALRTQPDRRLVALVRLGYESAFEEIVRRYGRPLGRYAASIVGGRSEDVLQDAFAKAIPALCRDDAEIDLRPWLFRVVRNTALNELRDNPASPEMLAEAIAGGGDPAEELERREELADLIRRLQALPERQRAAMVMRELEGLGHAEIAAALGLSGGGARQAIHRARQALRDGMGIFVPLPVLKAMLAGAGPGASEAAAGVGAATGAGMAAKATVATVLVAGAVGAGVALDHGPRTGETDATAATPGRTANTVRAAAKQPSEGGATASGHDGSAAQPQSGSGGGEHAPRSPGSLAGDNSAGRNGPSAHGGGHSTSRGGEDHSGPGRGGAPISGSPHSGPSGKVEDHSGGGDGQSGQGGDGGGGQSGQGEGSGGDTTASDEGSGEGGSSGEGVSSGNGEQSGGDGSGRDSGEAAGEDGGSGGDSMSGDPEEATSGAVDGRSTPSRDPGGTSGLSD
jgi:RNA polymerase sigma factor (sigma-70 family)